MTYRIRITEHAIEPDLLACMASEEANGAAEVSARPDTLTLTVQNDDGNLAGYAIFGQDEGDMIALYYAHTFVPVLGPLMMKQFFGVSKVMGQPLRMHVQSVRDIQVKARMFGAELAFEGVDADGIMQGVFS